MNRKDEFNDIGLDFPEKAPSYLDVPGVDPRNAAALRNDSYHPYPWHSYPSNYDEQSNYVAASVGRNACYGWSKWFSKHRNSRVDENGEINVDRDEENFFTDVQTPNPFNEANRRRMNSYDRNAPLYHMKTTMPDLSYQMENRKREYSDMFQDSQSMCQKPRKKSFPMLDQCQYYNDRLKEPTNTFDMNPQIQSPLRGRMDKMYDIPNSLEMGSSMDSIQFNQMDSLSRGASFTGLKKPQSKFPGVPSYHSFSSASQLPRENAPINNYLSSPGIPTQPVSSYPHMPQTPTEQRVNHSVSNYLPTSQHRDLSAQYPSASHFAAQQPKEMSIQHSSAYPSQPLPSRDLYPSPSQASRDMYSQPSREIAYQPMNQPTVVQENKQVITRGGLDHSRNDQSTMQRKDDKMSTVNLPITPTLKENSQTSSASVFMPQPSITSMNIVTPSSQAAYSKAISPNEVNFKICQNIREAFILPASNPEQSKCAKCSQVFFTANDALKHVEDNHGLPSTCDQPFCLQCGLKKLAKSKQHNKPMTSTSTEEGADSEHGDSAIDFEMRRNEVDPGRLMSSDRSSVNSCTFAPPSIDMKNAISTLNEPITLAKNYDTIKQNSGTSNKPEPATPTLMPSNLKAEAQYNCSKCPKKFSALTDLSKHVITTHNQSNSNEKPFCLRCGMNFSTNSELVDHVIKAHSNATQEKGKHGKSSSKTDSKNAKQTHSHEAIITPSNEVIITRNEEADADIEQSFKCLLCRTIFYQLHELREHMDRVHVTEYQFKCEVCHGIFKKKHVLLDHYRGVHLGFSKRAKKDSQELSIPDNCQSFLCGVTFFQKSYLIKHLYDQHQMRLLVLPNANENEGANVNASHDPFYEALVENKLIASTKETKTVTFSSYERKVISQSLFQHYIRSLNEGKKDPQCILFGSHAFVPINFEVYIRDDPSLQCASCAEVFNNFLELVYHWESQHYHKLIEEEGLKPLTGKGPNYFVCHACQKLFKEIDDLLSHLNSVHQIKEMLVCPKQACRNFKPTSNCYQFKCEQCDKNFSTKKNLKQHVTNSHRRR